MDLLREIRFAQIYAFKYSPRPDTSAAAMDDDVPETVKSRRLTELFELQDGISRAENQRLVGRTLPVLFDGASRQDPCAAAGRTPGNRVINVPGLAPQKVNGQILEVTLIQALGHSLVGAPPPDASEKAPPVRLESP
jgi:tRNA-2-methylthio-N6-dimethylallyladenosine synthase